MVEFRQSREEGIDIGECEELFKAVSHLPGGEYKERIADVMFDIVSRTPLKKDYEFDEPSERHSATSSRALRRPRPQNIRTPTASG